MRTKFKKCICILIFFIMLCESLIPTIKVFAETGVDANSATFIEGNWYANGTVSYDINSKGELKIIATKGVEELIIPDTIDGIKVKKINKVYGATLKYIEFPDSVTEFGDQPFCPTVPELGGQQLNEIKLPDGLSNMKSAMFLNCDNLISITIPKNVETIELPIFPGWVTKNLSDIQVDKENKVYTSENGVLFNKDKTKLIAYPPAKAEESYDIPNTVKEIEWGAFGGANATKITIPETVTKISNSAFMNNKFTSITIPNSVTYIGQGAFRDGNLKEITIPETVETIDLYAFADNKNLLKVEILNPEIEIDNSVFLSCNENLKIYGYEGSTADAYAKNNNIAFMPFGQEILEVEIDGLIYRIDNIEGTATLIGNKGNEELLEIYKRSIKIPDEIYNNGFEYKVDTIGAEALAGCPFEKIELPYYLKTIEDGAFKNSSLLLKVELPDNMQALGNEAFSNCGMLGLILIPKSVVECGKDIFKGSQYVNIYGYKNSVANKYADNNNIPFIAVDDTEGKGDIVIDGLIYKLNKVDGEATLVGMKSANILEVFNNYTKLHVPLGIRADGQFYEVVKIAKDALKNGEFKEVYLATVKEIEKNAFDACNNLTSVSIPYDVTSLDIDAFSNCKNLHEIEMHSPWYKYEKGILYNQYKTELYGCLKSEEIKDLVIPFTVREIKEGAFKRCESIRTVKIGKNVKKIADDAFDNIKNDAVIIGYRGSYAEKYAKEKDIEFQYILDFTWDKDNYNFTNSSKYFSSYSIGDFGRYISNVLNVKAELNRQKTEWVGSCAGLALTTILFKYGHLTPTYWQIDEAEAENPFDLIPPDENKELMYLINFYWIFQGDIKANCMDIIASINAESDIDDFSNYLNDFYNVSSNDDRMLYCGYHGVDEEGDEHSHAIVINGAPQELDSRFYRSRDEEFEIYKYRIPVYDGNEWNQTYMYLSEQEGNIIINFGDDDILQGPFIENPKIKVYDWNDDKILNLEEVIKNENKIVFSKNRIEFIEFGKVKISNQSGEYCTIEDLEKVDGSLECEIDWNSGTTVEGKNNTEAVVILKDDNWYTIETENETDELDAKMQFEDSYMTAKTKAGGKAIFENKKSVTLISNSNKEEYKVTLTLNDEFVTLPWYTITAIGTGAKEIKLEMVEEGTIVSGDNLKNLVVKANNSEETVEIKIDTDETKIFVTANNDDTKLIAYIDNDGDGIFETPLGEEKEDVDNKENENSDNKNEDDNDSIKTGDNIIYAVVALIIAIIIEIILFFKKLL